MVRRSGKALVSFIGVWDGTAYNERNATLKDSFHLIAQRRLRLLAAALQLAEGSFEVRSNRGGIGADGDISLTTQNLYVQVGFDDLPGRRVLARSRHSGKPDGPNHWYPLMELDAPEGFAPKLRALLKRERQRATIVRGGQMNECVVVGSNSERMGVAADRRLGSRDSDKGAGEHS